MTMQSEERRVWLAILFPARATDVVGAVRSSVRLHWTVRDARDEAERWAEEMRIGPIAWGAVDEQIIVGRTPTHVAVVRGIPLPRGDPPSGSEPETPIASATAHR
jgi:hypothetical protein